MIFHSDIFEMLDYISISMKEAAHVIQIKTFSKRKYITQLKYTGEICKKNQKTRRKINLYFEIVTFYNAISILYNQNQYDDYK